MFFHEYSIQPEQRNGTMVPRSASLDFFNRVDSGYFSCYLFDEAAAFAIRQQGNSQGLGRFAVYSDRLWIDVDRDDKAPEKGAEGPTIRGYDIARAYVREITKQFIAEDFDFTVWFSGSKGFHLCLKITPMQGKDVPYSQLLYVRDTLNVVSDFSLYQHGRLLSNPGRVHPKTGRKKAKVFEHRGKNVFIIPMIAAPNKPTDGLDCLTDSDLARIAFQRLSSFILDTPLAGMRHTKIWSLASALLEAGMSKELVTMNCLYVNKFLPDPKPDSEVMRAVDQAAHQLGVA